MRQWPDIATVTFSPADVLRKELEAHDILYYPEPLRTHEAAQAILNAIYPATASISQHAHQPWQTHQDEFERLRDEVVPQHLGLVLQSLHKDALRALDTEACIRAGQPSIDKEHHVFVQDRRNIGQHVWPNIKITDNMLNRGKGSFLAPLEHGIFFTLSWYEMQPFQSSAKSGSQKSPPQSSKLSLSYPPKAVPCVLSSVSTLSQDQLRKIAPEGVFKSVFLSKIGPEKDLILGPLK
ncbi:hypothetical protein A4X13_0g5653 [Tilletia indica]|uniref:Uncharacterized protein n=1 Tax=Tilletia indica TaxID=43049 RepID=A0A177TQD8_9BASI|nr:hypothetical protein A4X13_0g5653 [Tilletia indica]